SPPRAGPSGTVRSAPNRNLAVLRPSDSTRHFLCNRRWAQGGRAMKEQVTTAKSVSCAAGRQRERRFATKALGLITRALQSRNRRSRFVARAATPAASLCRVFEMEKHSHRAATQLQRGRKTSSTPSRGPLLGGKK